MPVEQDIDSIYSNILKLEVPQTSLEDDRVNKFLKTALFADAISGGRHGYSNLASSVLNKQKNSDLTNLALMEARTKLEQNKLESAFAKLKTDQETALHAKRILGLEASTDTEKQQLETEKFRTKGEEQDVRTKTSQANILSRKDLLGKLSFIPTAISEFKEPTLKTKKAEADIESEKALGQSRRLDIEEKIRETELKKRLQLLGEDLVGSKDPGDRQLGLNLLAGRNVDTGKSKSVLDVMNEAIDNDNELAQLKASGKLNVQDAFAQKKIGNYIGVMFDPETGNAPEAYKALELGITKAIEDIEQQTPGRLGNIEVNGRKYEEVFKNKYEQKNFINMVRDEFISTEVLRFLDSHNAQGQEIPQTQTNKRNSLFDTLVKRLNLKTPHLNYNDIVKILTTPTPRMKVEPYSKVKQTITPEERKQGKYYRYDPDA